MAIWIKPSGLEIEIQDSEEHEAKAVALGWTKKEDKPKRGRPRKVKEAE